MYSGTSNIRTLPASGDTIAAPDNYPSKGTGEIGTFFCDTEGNLIGIAQAVRETAPPG